MQFRMQDLLSKGLEQTVKQELDVRALFRDRADVIATGPLHIDLTIKPEGGIVIVEGTLSVDMELACSRCLEPTKSHSDIPFFEQFKPASIERGDEESEEEESDIIEVTDDKLDLQSYVEEYLLLFMPFAPLCESDCKGLCYQCGTNLNQDKCQCKNEKIDPRLESLKDFFKE